MSHEAVARNEEELYDAGCDRVSRACIAVVQQPDGPVNCCGLLEPYVGREDLQTFKSIGFMW
jgi:hypothetical protein